MWWEVLLLIAVFVALVCFLMVHAAGGVAWSGPLAPESRLAQTILRGEAAAVELRPAVLREAVIMERLRLREFARSIEEREARVKKREELLLGGERELALTQARHTRDTVLLAAANKRICQRRLYVRAALRELFVARDKARACALDAVEIVQQPLVAAVAPFRPPTPLSNSGVANATEATKDTPSTETSTEQNLPPADDEGEADPFENQEKGKEEGTEMEMKEASPEQRLLAFAEDEPMRPAPPQGEKLQRRRQWQRQRQRRRRAASNVL
eukprot:TRINITY_DN6380_c0_g1_i1.p1 TRINITY_DN6380_c0_g1~~TRINITY_DN6380_c0_g1_i1.p1  ORF type:complete len:270 (-),score=65.96 TRINITY_DN6380_c0_g1_i1:338-1147(-)